MAQSKVKTGTKIAAPLGAGLLEIVFGILFGVIFFAERPGPLTLVGALLIIFAAAIPYLANLKKPQNKQSITPAT